MSFRGNDGRKTGLAIIMIGLMLVIIGFGNYFEDKLKATTLTQNNISTFKIYKVENCIDYGLPSEWINSKSSVANKNITYCSEFISNDGLVKGNVEVWNNKDTKDIVKENEESIEKIGIKEYKTESKKIGDNNGYLTKYEMKKMNGKNYKKYDYVFKVGKNNVVARFYIEGKNYKENTPILLENILETFVSN